MSDAQDALMEQFERDLLKVEQERADAEAEWEESHGIVYSSTIPCGMCGQVHPV